MPGVTLSDVGPLLDIVGEAYAFKDLMEFRSGILGLLGRMVPCDCAGYNDIGADESFALTAPPLDNELFRLFTTLAHEKPIISRYQRTPDGRPYRISDVIDHDTFHQLALYRRLYRQIKVEHQVALALPALPP